MARTIKEGQSLYIPFVDGESVPDAHNCPRIYKTVEQFKKSYPGIRRETPKLVEYAPVVHSMWGEYESFPLAPSMNGYPCKNCGMHFSASSIPMLNYCPNCGAKMDL